MRTNLERNDLMRQSVGDMISGFRTGADIANVEAETATREAELPYVEGRIRAQIRALESAAGVDEARVREIDGMLQARINQLEASGALDREQAIALRQMTPAQRAEAMARAGLLTEQQKAVASGNEPMEITRPDGSKLTVPKSLGIPYLEEQMRTEQTERDRRAARRERVLQHAENIELKRTTQQLIERQRQESAARQDQTALETRRSKAAEAHGSILSNITPSGAYELSEGAVQSYVDTFNQNSDQPFMYIHRPLTPEERSRWSRLWYPKYKPYRVRKVILPRTRNMGQLTATEAFNIAAAEGMELIPWLEQQYKDLGIDMNDFIVDVR